MKYRDPSVKPGDIVYQDGCPLYPGIFIGWLAVPQRLDDGDRDFAYENPAAFGRRLMLASSEEWEAQPAPSKFEVGKRYKPGPGYEKSSHATHEVMAVNETHALTWVTGANGWGKPVPGSLPHSARNNWQEI